MNKKSGNGYRCTQHARLLTKVAHWLPCNKHNAITLRHCAPMTPTEPHQRTQEKSVFPLMSQVDVKRNTDSS